MEKMADPITVIDASNLALAVVMPLIFLAAIGALVIAAYSVRTSRRELETLMRQSTRSLEGLQVVSRQLLEAKSQAQSAQFLKYLPFALNDLSVSLSELLARTEIASEVVIYNALSRDGEARMAAVAGALLSVADSTPNFVEMFRRRLLKDEVAAGLAASFIEKFTKLSDQIRIHDFDGLLSRIFEEGTMGKSFQLVNKALKEEAA